MKRAKTVQEMINMKFDAMDFEGEWQEFAGSPAKTGVWILWGNSGNGKTRFALQLAKYLTRFGKVAYNSLEEGISLSLTRALQETRMEEVGNRFHILDKETIDEVKERLGKRRSYDIMIVDSYQYTGLTTIEYKALKEKFGKKKLIIFISHADGKKPQGRPAKFVRYDADVKIWVEGYKAFPTSRFGGGKPYTIWEEGAAEYWGEDD